MNSCKWSLVMLMVPTFIGVSESGALGQATTRTSDRNESLVRETVHPIHVIRRADGVFFIDFGRAAFGSIELEIPASADQHTGRKIVVRLGEKLADTEHLDSKPGGSVRFLETSITTEAGKTVYRPELTKKDSRWMPPDVGAVMPFRYAELENLPEATTVEQLSNRGVRQIAVHSAFDDAAADFSCSNEKLNAIWNLSKYSMKATSYAGVFVDGDRERKPYEADAYINQLGWYYCTGDPTLPRHTNDYLVSHPTWPTEWILFSVLSGWLDYQYTGETISLNARYDDLKAKTLRALEREDGLISSVEPAVTPSVHQSIHFDGKLKDIVDWPGAERDGYKMVPVNTVVNAFHCRSLIAMAGMAKALGKADDAADFQRAADHALKSLNSKLVDPKSGLYIDGEGTSHSSLHANMFPLALDLVPADRKAKVVDFVLSRGMACSVYGAQFLMDALFDNERGPEAVGLMIAPGDRSWRHMVEDTGTTIALEAWDAKYKPNQDWNHAWGAAPANLLPRMILGVEPIEPGYGKTLIWPRCAGTAAVGTLAWARGKVPTSKGPITVDWHQTAAGLHMMIELPPQSTALVRLPSDWGDEILLDGKPAKGQKNDHTVEIELATSGRHEMTIGR